MSAVTAETPLLTTVLHDGPSAETAQAEPPCRLSRSRLSIKQVLVLNILYAMQPLVFELIFPFVNQMLLETGVVNDPELVGYYSGNIESISSFMSFLALMPSSYLSDKFGRKPVILFGILGLAISTAFFGMSQSYLAMIISRCIGGTMGGTFTAVKVMTSEMTDRSNQGTAFSYLSISYRTGQMLGLPLGGYLAHPERRFSLFRSPFWYRFPFALPCFVAAGITVVCVAFGFFLLDETLVSKSRAASLRRLSSLGQDEYGAVGNLPEEEPKPPSLQDVLTPSIISLFCSVTAMCLVSEILFALYPIFAFTPVHSGGLGLSEAVIGTHLAIRSLLPIPIMLFYPSMERRLGTVGLYQAVMMIFPIVVLCFPTLNYLARMGVTGWVFNLALFGYFFAWAGCGFTWTCSSIMVTDASPSAEALARVHSISQVSILLPQIIAPAFATALFAASIRSELFGGNGVWVLVFIFAALAAFHSLSLKEPAVDWRNKGDGTL